MENLKLERRVKESLEEAGINSITAILAASETDLLANANLSLNDIKSLRIIASSVATHPQRVSVLLCQNGTCRRRWGRRLSLGCSLIDQFLKGGFPSRGITEISGESGSGKTQICLQAALAAQIPLLQESRQSLGTIFICTEDAFPSQRLRQLIKEFPERYPESKGIPFGDRIFVEHISDVVSLKECLEVRVPRLLRTSPDPFGLIVVDSIAGVFRGSEEYDDKDAHGKEHTNGVSNSILLRAKSLKEIAGELHCIASSYGVSIICVNQVSDPVDGAQGFGRSKKIPALGLSWANMVTTRLITCRTPEFLSIEQNSRSGARTLVRELEVIFSPELPQSRCKYVILQSGVEGLP